MEGDWKEEPLSENCSLINRGSAPRYLDQGGVLVLNQKCIRDQRVNFVDARRTNNKLKSISPDRMLRPFDILVNSTGVGTLGRVAQVLTLPEPATVDSHVTIVRPDPELIVPHYLGYAIRAYERDIEALAEGSTGQTELSRNRLSSLTIPIAPKDEQRAIAHILGTLDDKIELNRRMNETLEAMARALFKSWFVDFDPVRAKAEGRDTGLPKHIADLFPMRFVDSELGKIPEGWTTLNIGDLAEVSTGKRPDIKFSKICDQAKIPLWGGNGPMAFVPKSLVDGPILLTGRVGTLGSVFRITTPCWPSDNTLTLRAYTKDIFEYLYLQLQLIDYASFNRGSTQPLLTQTDLKSQRLLMPSIEALGCFGGLVKNAFNRIDDSEAESDILAAQRDLLLPKLISGELRIECLKKYPGGQFYGKKD